MWFKSSFPTPAVAAISFCLIGGTTPAYADLGDQLFKLLADDGAEWDQFGRSVAISGETAIVGARFDDDNGGSSGSAYLFDTTTGQQISKLLAKDGSTGDEFGISVAISESIALVGAWWDYDNGINSGSAYLFGISDPANPTQIAKLLAIDGVAHDHFGWSVAISDTTALVGARSDDDNGTNSGSAYLFDTVTGEQIAKLRPDDGAMGDHFGISVAISESIALVGAWLDDDNGDRSGSAYLFDPTTGLQIAKLLAIDGASNDNFGVSVAISGATAIVGASGAADFGFVSGSAYLFDISDPANPVQTAKLLADDGAEGDYFGGSVAISGAIAIVGATGDNDNAPASGAAYLFDTTTGGQIAKIVAEDATNGDFFGWSVAISGATAIVAAPADNDNGAHSGSAYLFDAVADATLFFEPDQPYLSEANSPLDTDSAGFILENFEDGLFNIPGVNASSGEVRFPGPFTDSVDLDDGVLDGFGTDGHAFRPSDGQTSITFTFDAKVLGQLPTQAGLVWTDGNPQAVVTFTAENAQGICVVETQVTLGDDVHNGETAEDRFFGVAFADGIGALSISTSFGGLEVDHVQFVVPCPWDLDGSGSVGASDLLSLLASWGPCKGCPADFDENGNLGASDLLALLANWGPCP